MIIKTRIFKFYHRKYQNLTGLAQAMEISLSQICRVREGKRNINQKFIVGAMQAFPGYKFDELFYFSPELPTVTSRYCRQGSVSKPATTRKREQRGHSQH